VKDEVWLKLPTGPDDEFGWASPIYWVSTLGRVYWYAPKARPHVRRGFKALRLHQAPGKKPHLVTNLHVANGGYQADRRVYVARLVLATHASPDSPLTPLGCHGLGGSTDNRISNLARGSYHKNLVDAYERGERGCTMAYAGESHGCPF